MNEPVIKAIAANANTTVVIPAGYYIVGISMQNTTGNAVTGGVKVGTTDGGIDVVAALAVGASALVTTADAALLKRVFSMSAPQTLFIQPVTSWNSANINISFILKSLL